LPEVFNFPKEPLYLGGYLNDEIIGLFTLHASSLGCKAHFQVLKPYRKYSREFIKLALDSCLCDKVYVEIPTLYMEVINFAKKSGFRKIGISDKLFLKNGIEYEKYIMEYT